MMLLVGTETVLFSSFIGAYLVLRMGAGMWPPAGTPVLTLGLSSVNTSLLVLSSILVQLRRLTATWWLGITFLGLQALEFHRLYARGLTLQTGTYGALFYSLITCHALHVLGGLIILAIARAKLSRDPSPPPSPAGGEGVQWMGNAQLYWHFVTAVWLVLFSILYIL